MKDFIKSTIVRKRTHDSILLFHAYSIHKYSYINFSFGFEKKYRGIRIGTVNFPFNTKALWAASVTAPSGIHGIPSSSSPSTSRSEMKKTMFYVHGSCFWVDFEGISQKHKGIKGRSSCREMISTCRSIHLFLASRRRGSNI